MSKQIFTNYWETSECIKTPWFDGAIEDLEELKKHLESLKKEREKYIEHAGKELDKIFREFVEEAFAMFYDEDGSVVAYLGDHCLGRVPLEELVPNDTDEALSKTKGEL